jgi:glycosyltransferase involved in cell wall biosynthesis
VKSLVIVANARMPSPRAQSLQVAQTAGAFARAGIATTLLHPLRASSTPLPPGLDVWDYYGLPKSARPVAEALRCIDWIDRVPRALQYVPARLQESSFAKSAALRVLGGHPEATVLSREAECALALVSKRRARVFLELHRVPGSRLRRRWTLAACKGAAGVIAISGGVRDDLVLLGVEAQTILVEHDGFESARFAGLPARQAARERLKLPADAPLVVYTGGLLEWKGAEVLVEAARALPDVYFAIAGGMPADVARLRTQAGGLANLRIDGFQAPELVPLYLAAGDLGVVPNRAKPAISAKYTSPLKVFEAMAVGLPLVASDLPSLREILHHGEDAWLVKPDDPQALADGIRTLVADPSLRARLGKTLGARASEHSWDARAARIIAWIDERSRGPRLPTFEPER